MNPARVLNPNAPPNRDMNMMMTKTFCRPSMSRFRSEEHTSELQSLTNLVCRLLLEKKKTKLRMTGLNPAKEFKDRHHANKHTANTLNHNPIKYTEKCIITTNSSLTYNYHSLCKAR